MPFDPVPVSRIATQEEFWAATPRQRLAMLAFALRHLPETHKWNFQTIGANYKYECGTIGCAVGLKYALWGGANMICLSADELGLPGPIADEIFGNWGPWTLYKVRLMHLVTPLMVADAIDRYLLTGDPRP